jgi:acetyl esterase/lipase
MPRFRRLAFCVVAASLSFSVPAFAGGQATWQDRIDQIIATFMGDPAANVDIDMKHVLDTWRGMHPKPLEDLSAEDARRQPTPIEAAAKLLKQQDRTLDPYKIAVRDITIDGATGPLRARVYQPESASPAGGSVPLVVFYHGGGFVLDNEAGGDASARAIAAMADAIVIAPNYRLAPEHKFPAAPDDALAAYKWVVAHAADFGGAANHIALAGEGAGGLLAADTAIAIHAAKLQTPVALALITPAAGIDLKTNSWIEDSTARPWNKAAVLWALNLYLPDEAAKHDWRMDLVGAANVDGLPPTTIVTAEDDPLRSDGERLGGKLRRATVAVEMRDYPGVTHDFFGMGEAVEKAAMAERFVGERLKQAFVAQTNDTLALEQLGVAPYPEAPDPASLPPEVPAAPVSPAPGLQGGKPSVR